MTSARRFRPLSPTGMSSGSLGKLSQLANNFNAPLDARQNFPCSIASAPPLPVRRHPQHRLRRLCGFHGHPEMDELHIEAGSMLAMDLIMPLDPANNKWPPPWI